MLSRPETWDAAIAYGKHMFSWLGEQCFEEMMLSTASYWLEQRREDLGIQGRIRRHLLLYWSPGWNKTSQMLAFKPFLESCCILSSATEAAVRGTVDQGKFLPPEIVLNNFVMIPDFASLMSKRGIEELYGILLTSLEEGVVRVALAKLANLDAKTIAQMENYGVHVDKGHRMYYNTHFICVTAAHRLPISYDEAFFSRFFIVYPRQKLTTELTEHVMTADRPTQSQRDDIYIGVRSALTDNRIITIPKDLRKGVMAVVKESFKSTGKQIDPRLANGAYSSFLCRLFWKEKFEADQADYDWLRLKVVEWHRGREMTVGVENRLMVFLNDGQYKTAREISEALEIDQWKIPGLIKRIGGVSIKGIVKGEETKYAFNG